MTAQETFNVNAVSVSSIGTGTKTISNAADSSTNFGKYIVANINGVAIYIPCGTVAPT